MPPLYPKMRERPAEFRINHDAPLAEGLVFAGLGGRGCVGSMVYPDSSLYGNHGRLTNMDAATAWVWDDTLKRFGLYFNNSRSAQVQLSRLPFHTGQGQVSIVTWLRPLGYSSQSAIFGEYAYAGWTRNYLYVTSSGVTFDQYPPSGGQFGLSVSWSSSRWDHLVYTATVDEERFYINGIRKASRSPPELYTGDMPTSAKWGYRKDGCYYYGFLSDTLLFVGNLADAAISALADPSNVDLRVGGVPLILPPRRRFWPVVSEQAIPKMVPWHLFQQVGV